MKREESSCKGSDQKGVCVSHPLSLLKHELVMPLHIFIEKVMAMGGRNGTSSGIFSGSDKEKKVERQVGEDYVHLHLDETSCKILTNRQRK